MQTKIFKDFCPTKQTRIIAKKKLPTITKKSPKNHQKNHQKKRCDPCLFGRAEILKICVLHFGRNVDLINSF